MPAHGERLSNTHIPTIKPILHFLGANVFADQSHCQDLSFASPRLARTNSPIGKWA